MQTAVGIWGDFGCVQTKRWGAAGDAISSAPCRPAWTVSAWPKGGLLRCHQSDTGVMMVVAVLCKEAAQGADPSNDCEVLGEFGLIFCGFEIVHQERIII